MPRKMLLALTALVMLISALIGAILVQKPWQQSTALSETALLQKVADQYEGEIVSSRVQGNSLYVEMKLDTGQYALLLDRSSGNITSIVRLSEGVSQPEASPAPSSSSAPLPTSTPPPAATHVPAVTPKPSASQKPIASANSWLTEEEAAQVALKHVSGQVKDVEQGDDDDYLVEIERADGSEATVQVHKISGKVLSITWDDDDNDDNDGNDSNSRDND